MAQFKVRDIMTTQVDTLSPTDTVKQATKKFALENISGAPVVDDDYRMVGIVTCNDILDLIMKCDRKYHLDDSDSNMLSVYLESKIEDPDLKKAVDEFSNTRVSDIMTRTVLTTSPESTVMDLLTSMISMDVGRVPVLEKGVLIGVVSRSDIIFSLYKKKI